MLGSLISKCYHWPKDLRYICLLSQGQPLRPGTPPPPDCMPSTIWLAVSTSWPSIIMNSNAGLDRCHPPRSLIVVLLDHENLYYSINTSLTFPCFASGKTIPRRKNSSAATLSRPDIELLISTNITYLPKTASFPRTIHLTHPIPSLRKTTTSVQWTKRPREYTKPIAFIIQAISASAGVATFPVAVRLIRHLQQTAVN